MDFSKMGQLMELAKQIKNGAPQIKEALMRSADAQRLKRIEGTAGAGLVKVVINGMAQVEAVHVDPSLLNPKKAVIVQDLFKAATNNAMQALTMEAGAATMESMASLLKGSALGAGSGSGTGGASGSGSGNGGRMR
jgi:DNA-binding YbaB/EbfC family protein